MPRWLLGVALLVVGSIPMMAALWVLATAQEEGSLPSVFVLLLVGTPAIAVGGFLVRRALRAERRALGIAR